MTKQEILDKFSDIDFVYNDSSKHETLSRMLDELLKEQAERIKIRDESLEKAYEEIKWLRGMLKEQEATIKAQQWGMNERRSVKNEKCEN